MEIFVTNPLHNDIVDYNNIFNINNLGVLQNYTSLQWLENYRAKGEFSISCYPTEENIEILKVGNCIYRNDTKKYGIIELVVSTNDEIIVKGSLDVIEKLVNPFSVNITNVFNGINDIMNNLYFNPYTLFASNEIKALVISPQKQTTFSSLQKTIIELCELTGIGYRLSNFNSIELYQGVDRSNRITFSESAENIINQELTNDITNMYNYAIVAGAGEGTERRVIRVENPNYPVSLKPYSELYVDARDISLIENSATSTTPEELYTDEEYNQLLINRGLVKLNELGREKKFRCDLKLNDRNVKYRDDFYLGDIVRIVSNKFNQEYNVRVVSGREIKEKNGTSFVFTLEEN